ncbi:actin cortical patch SUR7/pH-response regulator pali [Lactarius indigo]|nr:actin cortical patch SUR7/pH-response regulator pali [Lactarius indigo]
MACWRRRGRFDDYDDYHYLNRRLNQRHATLTGFCLFAAFLLFLFVALSLPIIKSIYLLQLDGITSSTQPKTSVATRLRFGVWGFCATSALSGSTGECIGPQLGYTIDPQTIAVVTDEQDLANLILKGLSVLLILHPIAAGLALLTLIPVTASCFVYHHLPWIISLVLSVPTAIASTVVFAADLALVIVARQKVKDHPTLNVSIDFGNGVWMVLVSTLFTWIAMVLLAARLCRCCGFGR